MAEQIEPKTIGSNTWTARRSGGRITVYFGGGGKRAGVDTIERQEDGRLVATDKDGKKFELA